MLMQKYKQLFQTKYLLFSSCLTEVIYSRKQNKFLSVINQLCKYFARAFFFFLGMGETNKKSLKAHMCLFCFSLVYLLRVNSVCLCSSSICVFRSFSSSFARLSSSRRKCCAAKDAGKDISGGDWGKKEKLGEEQKAFLNLHVSRHSSSLTYCQVLQPLSKEDTSRWIPSTGVMQPLMKSSRSWSSTVPLH